MTAAPLSAAKPRSLRYCPRCRTRQPWTDGRIIRAGRICRFKTCSVCGTATLAKAPQKAKLRRKGKRAALSPESPA